MENLHSRPLEVWRVAGGGLCCAPRLKHLVSNFGVSRRAVQHKGMTAEYGQHQTKEVWRNQKPYGASINER